MGRSTVALIVAILMIGGISLRIDDERMIGGCVVVVAFLFIAWFFSIMWYSTRHPDVALLEGAEWTNWKRFELGGKMQPRIAGTTEFNAIADEPAVEAGRADAE